MSEQQAILASIEFQMSLLLFVALAGYLIAYRINQSAVVGIILAGIIVGPSLLGLVTYTDFVASLGHLGAVVLLFTIGLHFNIKEITHIKYFVIAFVGIIVPWNRPDGDQESSHPDSFSIQLRSLVMHCLLQTLTYTHSYSTLVPTT